MNIHILNVLIASLVVIGGLLALNYLLRHYFSKSLINKSHHAGNLKLEDILYIDTNNRVVVVSRNNKQYVMLLSANNNLVLDCDDTAKTNSNSPGHDKNVRQSDLEAINHNQ